METLLLAGGLATVIYTDALQTVIMVVGAIILAVKGKGWGPGLGKDGLSVPASCHPPQLMDTMCLCPHCPAVTNEAHRATLTQG